MLLNISPKLPMRDRNVSIDFYVNKLGFEKIDSEEYEYYLMVKKDNVEIHFFEFKELDINENYGQVYIRTDAIEQLFISFLEKDIVIHPNGHLSKKLWGQKEFSILDPDNNLLTFGQPI
ncbi:VOC family protein [Flavobacterium silvisoli]|uniref:Bleomycin resistance protein n=1 Tax=Flavobacterium silvisoli TaxID=2529433 RepID=A0A4Q9Z0Z7_9FLAO|nr:VOC family protein [Flavobacterium silvisoli]TBX69892.1 VOC family protein [Flavobacterium silvisoli]